MVNDCKHCWHDSIEVIAVHPPIQKEICCHCGEKKTKPQPKFEQQNEHGKYAPYKNYTFTSTKLNDC